MSDVSGGLTDIPPNFSVCRDGVDLVSHTAFTMWVVPEVGILVLNLVFLFTSLLVPSFSCGTHGIPVCPSQKQVQYMMMQLESVHPCKYNEWL